MNDLLQFDQQYNLQGYPYIIGIDEAGRGPLAGPVVAGAVCFKTTEFSVPIRDSKKLSHRQREKAFEEILDKAYVGIGVMNEWVIDSFNILQASFLAMNAAVRDLRGRMDADIEPKDICLLIDGNRYKTKMPYHYETIIGGDKKSLSIAAASIVAKVFRDRILTVYHDVFPEYGFAKHKGYPTADHRKVLQNQGPSPIHRRTFRTVRDACRMK